MEKIKKDMVICKSFNAEMCEQWNKDPEGYAKSMEEQANNCLETLGRRSDVSDEIKNEIADLFNTYEFTNLIYDFNKYNTAETIIDFFGNIENTQRALNLGLYVLDPIFLNYLAVQFFGLDDVTYSIVEAQFENCRLFNNNPYEGINCIGFNPHTFTNK